MRVFVCVLFVSNTSNIGFNSSANVITVNNLLAKDIDQYFKTEFNVEDSCHQKSVLVLPNGMCKFGERAHDRNLISTVDGI